MIGIFPVAATALGVSGLLSAATFGFGVRDPRVYAVVGADSLLVTLLARHCSGGPLV